MVKIKMKNCLVWVLNFHFIAVRSLHISLLLHLLRSYVARNELRQLLYLTWIYFIAQITNCDCSKSQNNLQDDSIKIELMY